MFYPQISNRCLVQYPVKKVLGARTITVESAEGNRTKLADTKAAKYLWLLTYRGLTREEVVEIKDFFSSTEGSLVSFSFIDPVGNILQFSEALSMPPWEVGVGMIISAGAADPFGGTGASALINTTGMPVALQQACPVPGQFTYCLSFWAKGTGAPTISAGWTTGSASVQKVIQCNERWKRYEVCGSTGVVTDTTTFRVEMAAGTRIDLAGIQVEAQLQASAYRRTYSESGVFNEAHFVDDELLVVATANGEYSTDIRIESRWKELG